MKKSIFAKVGAAAVVLTLVTASLVGGTFAKYVTSTTGTAKATVAEWKVAFNDKDGTSLKDVTMNLQGSADKADRILPGDKGQIDIKIYGQDAEVGYTYTIKVTKADGGTLDGMKFYSDAARTTEIPADGLTADVEYSATGTDMNKDVSLFWELPAGADSDAEVAMAGKTADYTISMVATQGKAADITP
ncbi:hypothetical protein [Clostridium sp. AM58-1XD]|uniref:hypothetical protein n=1 Tax=Clostridium sp. AM58-1XD TaxID=2292307 RepID=UPI000E4867A4|nr:hypothetical protein [Clostridium sp. AM58-1XD]RGY98591.1 hypothetical protein DXA13_10955 [Clostridium sp. AM58-1XD]